MTIKQPFRCIEMSGSSGGGEVEVNSSVIATELPWFWQPLSPLKLIVVSLQLVSLHENMLCWGVYGESRDPTIHESFQKNYQVLFVRFLFFSSNFLFSLSVPVHIFSFCAEPFSLLLAATGLIEPATAASFLSTKKITSFRNKVSPLTANIYSLKQQPPTKSWTKISSNPVYAFEVWKSLCGQFSQTRCDRKLRASGKNHHFIARNNYRCFSTTFIGGIQKQDLHHWDSQGESFYLQRGVKRCCNKVSSSHHLFKSSGKSNNKYEIKFAAMSPHLELKWSQPAGDRETGYRNVKS